MGRRDHCTIGCLLATMFIGMSSLGISQGAPQSSAPSEAQQKRQEVMKSRGPEGSITILPINLAGNPFARASEVVGLFLEQQGLENIEIGATPFMPAGSTGLDALVDSLGTFVKTISVKTEYVLYAEYNGNRQTGLVELRAAVVDKAGQPVWMDRQGAEDEAMKQLDDKDPMTFSVFLVERLCPALGLSEETAKNAKPGKMAGLMEERSGMPPEKERTPMPERQKLLKEAGRTVTLVVYPVRIGGVVDTTSTQKLVSMIRKDGLCLPVASTRSPALKASQEDPNEMKVLWNFAREVRAYSKEHMPAAGYALYADYVFNPEQWEQGYVHFVVCDPSGEWVIVDLQNSHHPDYQNVKPTSTADCHTLLVRQLNTYLH